MDTKTGGEGSNEAGGAGGGVIGSAAPPAGEVKTEAKGGEPGKVEAKGDGKAATPPTLELKFPEGFKPNEKHVTAFKAAAQKLKLDSAGAQELFDLQAQFDKERASELEAELSAQEKTWEKELAEDKEFGGKHLAGNKIALGKFFKQYDPTGAARKLIGESGLGSHPTLVKFFFGLAKGAAEDKVGDTGGAAKTSEAPKKRGLNDPEFLKRLFPKSYANAD